MNIKEALNRVVAQLDLSTEEMQDVMREIMTGQCSEAAWPCTKSPRIAPRIASSVSRVSQAWAR